MALISLREYGKIHVGEQFDPLRRTLSFVQGDVLANLKPTYGVDIFKYVNRSIRFLLGVARTLQNQRQLAELLLVFEGVSDCPRAALPWHRVVFDRLSDRYKACYKLAELFLRNSPPDVSGGRAQGFSLFFDMNVLFEEYIGRAAQRVFGPLGYRVQLQGPLRHLVFDMDQCRPAFAMKPDVVGLRQGTVEWILDTKWKQLSQADAKDGVAQSDLYQMHGYAHSYGCAEVVLLYPHHEGLGEGFGVRNNYQLHPWLERAGAGKPGRRIRIATIDLSNLKTVGAQLALLFSGGGAVKSGQSRGALLPSSAVNSYLT